MYAVLMGTFAFVMAAGALGGVLWIISALKNGEEQMDSLWNEIAALKKQSPTELGVQVADLAGALDALKVSNRREFGKLWGTMGGRTPDNVRENSILDPYGAVANAPPDDHFDAMIALQGQK